jgi:hypothetical protein
MRRLLDLFQRDEVELAGMDAHIRGPFGEAGQQVSLLGIIRRRVIFAGCLLLIIQGEVAGV